MTLAKLPRRFIWLGETDITSTHLTLESGQTYLSSAVSDALLRDWYMAGRITFLPDAGDDIPRPGAVLDVQDGIIAGEDLLGYIDEKLKFEPAPADSKENTDGKNRP